MTTPDHIDSVRSRVLARLVAIRGEAPGGDRESAHQEADRLLVELLRAHGEEEITIAYEAASEEFYYI